MREENGEEVSRYLAKKTADKGGKKGITTI